MIPNKNEVTEKANKLKDNATDKATKVKEAA